ncbi:MAG: hypothetical protein WA156_14500 [Methylocystis silviterrae]|jgi:hypothetical protein
MLRFDALRRDEAAELIGYLIEKSAVAATPSCPWGRGQKRLDRGYSVEAFFVS